MRRDNLGWARVSAVTEGKAKSKEPKARHRAGTEIEAVLPRTQEQSEGGKQERLSREVAPIPAPDIHSETCGI